jgi:gliding motility-associated-like protein
MIRLFFFFLLFLGSNLANASHGMGGEITYKCVGGNSYVFELIFYRDCNGADVNTMSENIRVWNHPSVANISLAYISRQDISPLCTQVSGGPSALSCGTGSAGGNGIGAIERITYRSAAIVLSGIPPAEGWVFTFENFSRSGSLTNINTPTNYGITLAAKIYAVPGASVTGCSDSSPIFLQEPYFVSCAGTPYVYNMNAVDPDLDSLHFDFGVPYDRFPTGIYNPPTNPIPVPFENGFSYNSPTPGINLNPSNVPAEVDPMTGELTFTSFSTGNYAVKISVKSYRKGVLISEVEREMQLVVMSCNASNTAPIYVAPFSGNSFVTTVTAGSMVSFTLTANDSGTLQDGSSQTLYLKASGPMFGANLTATTGCDIEPCATLNSTSPITGQQSVSANFNWETTCDHLVNQYGIVADVVPYNFVFKVQDDYCEVPKVTYATITVNVVNPGVIPATRIKCIQTDPLTNDLTIQWNPVSNPQNSFVEYQIHSLQTGLIASISDINQTTITVPAVNAKNDFFVTVKSGCNGNALKNSDTVSNVFLNVVNPVNGTAILQWNKPTSLPLSGFGEYYRIYREYPAGTFTLLDSVAFNSTTFKDTIDICQAYISYKVVLPTIDCDFTSNIIGDAFEDMLTPDIPFILSAGVDTSNNHILLTWNENPQPDTYGYVVYTFDQNGILYELDTVWGRANTSYSYIENLADGPFSYSVAAFDSCSTTAVPITFQTSAKGLINTTMTSSSVIYMCEKLADLTWSAYNGQTPINYKVWAKSNGQWTILGATSDTTISVSVNQGKSYCVYIQANFSTGFGAFSSPTCFTVPNPGIPAYHYFKLATIIDKKIELYDYVDASVGVSKVKFERKNSSGNFEEIGSADVNSDVVFFVDNNVDTDKFAWEYRTKYVDSCGEDGNYANENTTVFVSGSTDEYYMINTIQWSPYIGFNGGIVEYHIFRGVDGNFDQSPIAIVPSNVLNYIDDVSQVNSNGSICYHIEAKEGLNSYNFSETSRSNDFCIKYSPLVFVPNAFTPDGLNPIFKPVLSNVSTSNYNFSIIDRWGQIVFETNDNAQGWDGRIASSGKQAANDVFLYVINFQDQNNIKFSKRGFVTLLK